MVFKEDKKFSKIFSSGLGHTFRVFSHSLDTVSTGQIHVWYEFDTVWTEIWINFNLIKKIKLFFNKFIINLFNLIYIIQVICK
jgi:hypothetical protein